MSRSLSLLLCIAMMLFAACGVQAPRQAESDPAEKSAPEPEEETGHSLKELPSALSGPRLTWEELSRSRRFQRYFHYGSSIVLREQGTDSYYLYREERGDAALLGEYGSEPYAIPLESGWALWANGGVSLLDSQLNPVLVELAFPESWELGRILGNNLGGFNLLFDVGEEELAVAVYDGAWQQVCALETGYPRRNGSISTFSVDVDVYGEYLLIDSPLYNCLLRVHMETGRVDRYYAEEVFRGGDWAVSLGHADLDSAGYEEPADNTEPLRVTLWLEGEPAAAQLVDGIRYRTQTMGTVPSDMGYDQPVAGDYDRERNTVSICQQFTRSDISMDTGAVAREEILPDISGLTPVQVSPNGRYRVYYIGRGHSANQARHCTILAEDAETGEVRRLFDDTHSSYGELFLLTDTKLLRTEWGEFYDLATGEKLELALQLPSSFAQEVLGLAEREDGSLVALRSRSENWWDWESGEGMDRRMQLELYRPDGVLQNVLPTSISTGFRQVSGGGLGPIQVRTQIVGDLLYVEDYGYTDSMTHMVPVEEETVPGVAVVNLNTLAVEKRLGRRWAVFENFLFTGEKTGDGVRLYYYMDGALKRVEEHRFRFTPAEWLTDWGGGIGWELAYDPEAAELVISGHPYGEEWEERIPAGNLNWRHHLTARYRDGLPEEPAEE